MGWGDGQANNPESLIPTPNINRLTEDVKQLKAQLNKINEIGLRFMSEADQELGQELSQNITIDPNEVIQ